MAAHRYWRVLGVNIYNSSGAYSPAYEWSASTLEFYDANLKPLIKGVSTGGIGTTATEGNVSYAFDYQRDTRWTCSNSGTKYLGYDFGAGVAVDVRGFRWANRNDQWAFQSFRDYAVQYSDDGVTWTTAWTGTDNNPWPNFTTRYYFDPARPYVDPSGSHRFWRVYVTALSSNATDNSLSGSELEFFDAAGNPLVQNNPTSYIATSWVTGGYPEYAFDNNLTTAWTAGAGMPAWIGYDFGEYHSVAVAKFKWTSTDSGKAYRSPSAGKLQYSDDGTNWTDSFSFTDSVPWTTQESRFYPASTGATAVARPQIFICT